MSANNNAEYLDKTGLNKLVDNIQTLVSTEDNKKIDKPSSSVPAGKVLQTDSNHNAVWGDAVPDVSIAAAVSDYLDGKITPGTAITIDDTLTQTDQAADAKATGDAIDDLRDNLIAVSDTQPSSTDNRVWVKETPLAEKTVAEISELEKVSESVAPNYDDLTFPIKAGTICTHNLDLYVAKQDIPTLETWTSGHWSAKTNIAAEVTSLSSALSGKNFPSYANANCVMGTSDRYFDSETLDINITSVNNRVMIGPFYLDASYEITCSPGIKYILMSLIVSNPQTQTRYSELYTGWQTGRHIVAGDEENKNKIRYYFVVANSDDSAITESPDDCKNKIWMTRTYNKYDLIETYTVNASDYTPVGLAGSAPNYGRGLLKLHIDVGSKIYFRNTSIKFTAFCSEEYNSVYPKPIYLPGNSDVKLLFGNNLATNIRSIFENYETFEDFYDDLGLTIEPYTLDKKYDPYDNANVVRGVISSYDTSSQLNWEPVIDTTTRTSIVVGPFYFDRSVTIETRSSNIKYKACFLFENNDHSNKTYIKYIANDAWGSNTPKVIGCSEKSNNYIKWYIQLAYSDSRIVSDINYLKNQLIIKDYEAENPFHVIQCGSALSDGTPMLVDNTGLRLWLEAKTIDEAYLYFGNKDITYDIYYDGAKQNTVSGTAENEALIIPANKHIVCTVSFPGSRIAQFSSYKQLYDYLGLNILYSLRKKEIDGMMDLSDHSIYYPSAIERGGQLSSEITEALRLSYNNGQYYHVPDLHFYHDKAFICYQATVGENMETSENTQIQLAIVDPLDTSDIEYAVIGGKGINHGISILSWCNDPWMIIDADNGIARIGYNSKNPDGMLVSDYDIDSGDITTQYAKLVVGGVSYDFTTTNYHNLIGKPNGIKHCKDEIIITPPAFNGVDKYYCCVSAGDYKFSKNPILVSNDGISWELFCVPDVMFGSDCEVMLYVRSGFIYGASRHHYSDSTLRIWKMDISTKKIIDTLQIADCATRPVFYEDSNGHFYVGHGLNERKTFEIYEINSSYLAQSKRYIVCNYDDAICYEKIQLNNNKLYLVGQVGRGSGTTRVIFTEISY